MRTARVLGLLAVLACSPAQAVPDSPPIRLLASLAIEPPTLRIGDVVTLEIRVVTPPGSRVLAYVPPEIPEVWLLDAETLEPRHDGSRWLHATRIRIRPRVVGAFEWPASRITVESQEGQRSEIEVPGRTLEVVSVLSKAPERVEPFGLRTASSPATRGVTASVLAAVAGAAVCLLGVAIVSAVRTRRRRAAARVTDAPDDSQDESSDLRRWALRELQTARELQAADPLAAARDGAALLRQYLALRFQTDVASATTPELEMMAPPLALTSAWPPFVRILRALDEARFRPPEGDIAEREGRIGAALEEIRRFIEHTPAAGSKPR